MSTLNATLLRFAFANARIYGTLDADIAVDFAEQSEHIELATWNDGNVYSRDPADIYVQPFTGFVGAALGVPQPMAPDDRAARYGADD